VSTEQEYDTQQSRSMLDHPDADADPDQSNSSPTQLQGAYPPQYGDHQQHPVGGNDYYQQPFQPGMSQSHQDYAQYGQQQHHVMQTSQPESRDGASGQFSMGQVVDPNDPMLDADPFGLSASMHYPTSYGAVHQQPPHR
jgi:hypothetical protein